MSVDAQRMGWRTGPLLVVALVAAVAALIAAIAAIAYFAYDRQSSRVEKVQAENAKLEHDHMVIGTQFAQQSARLNDAMQAMSNAYGRGFDAGHKAATLPRPFAELQPSVRQGYVVPVAVPRGLSRAKPVVKRGAHGYTIRWGGLALFASDREPLRDWTAKAWPGTQRRTRIGQRTVLRMVGPFGTVYAWRERNKTYAVAALPRSVGLVSSLVRVLG
jgi:hypothetical protein